MYVANIFLSYSNWVESPTQTLLCQRARFLGVYFMGSYGSPSWMMRRLSRVRSLITGIICLWRACSLSRAGSCAVLWSEWGGTVRPRALMPFCGNEVLLENTYQHWRTQRKKPHVNDPLYWRGERDLWVFNKKKSFLCSRERLFTVFTRYCCEGKDVRTLGGRVTAAGERFLLICLSFSLTSFIFLVIRMNSWTHLVCGVITIFLDRIRCLIWMRLEVWVVWFIYSSTSSPLPIMFLNSQDRLMVWRAVGDWTLNQELVCLLNDAHKQTRRHGGETSHFGGSQYDIHPSDCPEFKGKGILITWLTFEWL